MVMNREEKITKIDWENQIFETEDGSVLPFVVDEEINVLNESRGSSDGVVYVYNVEENEKQAKN
jgi:hypothetical protein